uniref:Uncharacterized protein n=1 Tax=Lutzomyia longipalpis TaxID=7200 RepID=A0A1B0GKM9_LUTLO
MVNPPIRGGVAATESHVVTMPFITSRWLRELVLQLSCQQQSTRTQCPPCTSPMTHTIDTARRRGRGGDFPPQFPRHIPHRSYRDS